MKRKIVYEDEELPRKRRKVQDIISKNKELEKKIVSFKKQKNDLLLLVKKLQDNCDFLEKVREHHKEDIEKYEVIEMHIDFENTMKDFHNTFYKKLEKIKTIIDVCELEYKKNDEEIQALDHHYPKCGICFYPLVDRKDFIERQCDCKLEHEPGNTKYMCWKCICKCTVEKRCCLESVDCPFCKKKMFPIKNEYKKSRSPIDIDEPPSSILRFLRLMSN